MIIGSYTPLVVGSRAVGLIDKDKKDRPDQPYVILKEVTFEDWVKELTEDGNPPSEFDKMFARHCGRFYQIATD